MISDMELINGFARKALTEDEVYVFNVTLCDNEVDRDFEAFDEPTLEQLGKLFIGKTGIRDHSMRASDQNARIYRAYTEKTPGRKTSYGAPYVSLKANAYMIRTEENESLIKEIDGGIKKEVSVGCSVKSHVCSICGKEKCNHRKGKAYDGKMCFFTLKDAIDAYEWSFVAVPCQREAGVTKNFNYREKNTLNSLDKLLIKVISESNESEESKKALTDFVTDIQQNADEGLLFRESLENTAKGLAFQLMPELNESAVEQICRGLNTQALENLCKGLREKKSKLFPPLPQLKRAEAQQNENNFSEYKI